MFKKLKWKERMKVSKDSTEEKELISFSPFLDLIKKSMNSDDFVHYCYPKFEQQ